MPQAGTESCAGGADFHARDHRRWLLGECMAAPGGIQPTHQLLSPPPSIPAKAAVTVLPPLYLQLASPPLMKSEASGYYYVLNNVCTT